MENEDAYFSVWSPRVDVTGPATPLQPTFTEAEAATGAVEVVFDDPGDANISSGVYGTQVDEFRADYRYRSEGAQWSNWRTTDDFGFTAQDVQQDSTLEMEIKLYDRAGNVSPTAFFDLTVPETAASEATIRQAQVPVVVCFQYCAPVAAGLAAGATVAGKYAFDNLNFDLGRLLNGRPRIEQATEDSTSFDDYEARARSSSQRRKFREDGVTAGEVQRGEEAHHIVAAGDRRAAYAREILFKCGVNPNDFFFNGVGVNKKHHRRMHTNAYYKSINRILRRYDPDRNIKPCSSPASDDPFDTGLGRVLQDIAKYIKQGRFPG